MALVKTIQPKMPAITKRTKVAAYARVSKDTTNLLRSFANQVSFYSEYIQQNPEWEYVAVYADEAKTGTRIFQRTGFQEMIKDAEAGKFELLLVKSISRFSRNTVDCLTVIRQFKNLGIDVYFEKENIHTLSADGEFMLTVLTSLGQEEIYNLSENVKWSRQKRYQEGDPQTRSRLLGYYWDGDKLVKDPETEMVVRRIFREYMEPRSCQDIADRLNRDGFRTIRGAEFDDQAILYILRNITYTGRLLLQKTYVADPIKKNRIRNKGERTQYFVEESHEAIIDDETFENVQKELDRRSMLGWGHNRIKGVTCFYQKIKCGKCGCNYVNGHRKCKNGYVTSYFYCGCSQMKMPKCGNCQIAEETLRTKCATALGIEEFEENLFKEKIDRIVVTKDEPLRIVFKDGSYKKLNWKRRIKYAQGYSDTCN